jgi:hypothetical protein
VVLSAISMLVALDRPTYRSCCCPLQSTLTKFCFKPPETKSMSAMGVYVAP